MKRGESHATRYLFSRTFPVYEEKMVATDFNNDSWLGIVIRIYDLFTRNVISFIYTVVDQQSNGKETNAQIMSTYVELMNTSTILREIQTKLNSTIIINELTENLNVTNPQNTRILNTSFTYSNPKYKQKICQIFSRKIRRITDKCCLDGWVNTP